MTQEDTKQILCGHSELSKYRHTRPGAAHPGYQSNQMPYFLNILNWRRDQDCPEGRYLYKDRGAEKNVTHIRKLRR